MKKHPMICLALALILGSCLLITPALASTAEEAQNSGVSEALQSAGTVKTLTSAFLVLYGGISLFAPKKLWGLSWGRREKMRREPTSTELNAERVSGAIFIFLGVMLFLGRIR